MSVRVNFTLLKIIYEPFWNLGRAGEGWDKVNPLAPPSATRRYLKLWHSPEQGFP